MIPEFSFCVNTWTNFWSVEICERALNWDGSIYLTFGPEFYFDCDSQADAIKSKTLAPPIDNEIISWIFFPE